MTVVFWNWQLFIPTILIKLPANGGYGCPSSLLISVAFVISIVLGLTPILVFAWQKPFERKEVEPSFVSPVSFC